VFTARYGLDLYGEFKFILAFNVLETSVGTLYFVYSMERVAANDDECNYC